MSVLVGTLAYHLFVLVLLHSTEVDQKAGKLLLLNTPVMAIWIVCWWCAYEHTALVGIIAAAVQCVIASLQIVSKIGDEEAAVLFNGGIALVWLLLAAICWKYTRPRRSQGIEVDAVH